MHSSSALSEVFKSPQPDTFLESLLLNDAACEHDAIVLVDHIGVRVISMLRLSGATNMHP